MSAPSSPLVADTPVLFYVEDEDNDVLFMRRALDRAGLSVNFHTACDGDQAVAFLAAESPHGSRPVPNLIILDLNLPARSGFEVLEWLRQQPALRAVPVVILSSSGRIEDRERAVRLGANDYLVKPPSPLLLVDIVGKLWTRWLAPKHGVARHATALLATPDMDTTAAPVVSLPAPA